MKRKKRILISGILCLVLCVAFAGNALAFSTFMTVGIGATGPYTMCIQDVIKYNHTNLYVDGIFGQKTQDAVKAFQSSNGLSADGIVGWRTWDKLYSKLGNSDYIGYYHYLHRILKSNGSYTNTVFFEEQDYLQPNWHEHWDVYVAAPGTDPGEWYKVNYQ